MRKTIIDRMGSVSIRTMSRIVGFVEFQASGVPRQHLIFAHP
jgi:hypothetical protein